MGLDQGRGGLPLIQPHFLAAARLLRVRAKIAGRLRHLKRGHFGDVEPVEYGVSDCDKALNGLKFKVGLRSVLDWIRRKYPLFSALNAVITVAFAENIRL